MGQAGEGCEGNQNSTCQEERLRGAEDLFLKLHSQPVFGTGAGGDHAAGDGNHQCRNYGYEAVAYGQDGVGLKRLHDIYAMLQNADQQSGHNVNGGNEDTGYGVALGKAPRASPKRR